MAEKLKLEDLSQAVIGGASAFRCVSELEPAGGTGDKVFPPTYEKGAYAKETRIVDGERVPCVVLDSVASQANRIELALLRAVRTQRISLPLIEVDFSKDFPDLGTISHLEAPHRIADAILRDATDGENRRFRETEAGRAFTDASLQNATALFQWCPTALILGMWDSTGKGAGMATGRGVKFARTLVSEIVGIDIEQGVKTKSRIDPLQIEVNAGILYKTTKGWSLKGTEKLGKDGRPSEANHGNVTPTVDVGGGVTLKRIRHYVALSLPGLRRLNFPDANGSQDVTQKRSEAGRTVLAALALCGATLAKAEGLDLRSRCLLVEPRLPEWELLGAPGEVTKHFFLDVASALALLKSAVDDAAKVGLAWHREKLTLKPLPDVVTLVKKSRGIASLGDGGEGAT